MKIGLAFGVALAALLAGLPPFANAQEAQRGQPPAAVDVDAIPDRAAPDPLTPEEKNVPLLAPGAPAEKAAEAAETPAAQENEAISAQILARLASAGGKQDAREDVSGMTAFYTQTKGQPVWTSKDGFTANAKKAANEIRDADDWGLDASAFHLPADPDANASPETLAEAELKLSLAVLKYARHARGGRLDPPSISPVIDRQPQLFEPKSVLQGIAAAHSADEYLRGLHPRHEQFRRLRQALVALKKSAGSQAAIRIPAGRDFRPGDDDPQIALLRKRLQAGLEVSRDTTYDTALLEAVNRYQREHGLEVTGIADRKLRASLNEAVSAPPGEKRMRILVNMERWRWMPSNLGEFYVWDSVPEQLTRVFDHGKMTLMERIVVGKPSSPTPTFTANMQFITFNPEWGVPEGIKVNEIAPKLRNAGGGFFFFGGSSDVLARLGGLRVTLNGREVDPNSVDWASVDIRRYQFIQGAGARNVLGIVKFRFPNKHDVYMHDTPDRHLFNNGLRAFSHGCMRTQNPVHLAEVLLAHDKGWSAEQVRSMAVAGGATNEIKLTAEIPVHVAYFTAEVDDNGQLRTFGDLYGLDAKVASALNGQPVKFESDPVASADNEDRRRSDRPEPASRERDRQRWGTYGRPWNPFEGWN